MLLNLSLSGINHRSLGEIEFTSSHLGHDVLPNGSLFVGWKKDRWAGGESSDPPGTPRSHLVTRLIPQLGNLPFFFFFQWDSSYLGLV